MILGVHILHYLEWGKLGPLRKDKGIFPLVLSLTTVDIL